MTEEYNNGESLKASIILRMIMSTGAGLMIKIGTTAILCPVINPINTDMCTQLTANVWNLLIQGGMVPIAFGSLGGVIVMFISGKWKRN